MSTARVLPAPLSRAATTVGRAVLGTDVVPAWSAELPGGGAPRLPRAAADPAAVYFPACVSTMFGPADGSTGVQESFLALCDRAEVQVAVPDGIGALCCGTPWKSKGLTAGYDAMRDRAVAVLLEATDRGRLPVVVDASSCTEGLQLLLRDVGITVVDAVAFVDSVVLPALPPARRVPSLVLHRTCSSTQLGLDAALRRVAAVAADQVVEPDAWGCCAFAGDRGLLHPELTAAATAAEAAEVAEVAGHRGARHASLNRTCELGMTRATGQPYRHVLEVLDEVTALRPAAPSGPVAEPSPTSRSTSPQA